MERAHWAGLDGLRGVAAAAVVLFHAQLWFANGYAGVDVFFALSGFLITSLLLREHAARGRVSLGRFYARRILRLYPALLLACVGVIGLGVLTHRADRVAPAAVAALGYVSNWWIYLGRPAPLLEHTWTLAIEEHFYLIWPPTLMLLLSGRPGRRRWGAVVIAVAAALLIVRWPVADAVRDSYARGVPIVWGAVIAIVLQRRPTRPAWDRARPGVLVLASAALLVLLALPSRLPEALVTGPCGLAGLLAVVVVLATVAGPDGRGGWWGARPLVWLGRRSYGLYLYHFPLLSLAMHQLTAGPALARRVLAIGVTLVVTAASYRVVEQPLLRLKDRRFGERLESAPVAAGDQRV